MARLALRSDAARDHGAAVQPRRNLVRAALSPMPLRAVGKISYGLYLWHWPLIVFYGVLLDPALMATIGAALVIIGADARRW